MITEIKTVSYEVIGKAYPQYIEFVDDGIWSSIKVENAKEKELIL